MRRRRRRGHAGAAKINLTFLSVVSANVWPIFDNRFSKYQYVSIFIFCRNESRVHFNCPKTQIHEICCCQIKPNYKTFRIFDIKKNFKDTLAQPKGWGAAELQPPTKRNFKEADFVEKIITKVLQERGFSLNQPLKSAED